MLTSNLPLTGKMDKNSEHSIHLDSSNLYILSSDNSSVTSLSKYKENSPVNIPQSMEFDENGTLKGDQEMKETCVSDCSENHVAAKNAIAIFTRPQRILLKNINDQISCSICSGYLIDATTIVECLHSFCRSCIMNHLKQEHSCPQCKIVINTAKPNIKSDTTLQAIVYKLVPGLYEKELMRKRGFYRDRPKEAMLASPEQRGDDTENLIFGPAENMSLSLEYADLEDITSGDNSALKSPKYLQCPAIFSIAHLKKFIVYKFAVDYRVFTIEIMYKVKTIVLPDHYTLMDVAYIYTWKRDAPMRFFFRVRENNNKSLSNGMFSKQQKKNNMDVASPDPNELVSKNAVLKHNKEAEEIVTASQSDGFGGRHAMKNSKFVTQTTTTETFESTVSFSLDYHEESPKADKIKLTLINKNKTSKNGVFAIYESNMEKAGESRSENMSMTLKSSKSEKSSKTEKLAKYHLSQRGNSQQNHHHPQKAREGEERKVENIKLKIDLSKQSSITIINMSSPDGSKKESSKSNKPEKEWKLKTRKDKDEKFGSMKTFLTSSNIQRAKEEKKKEDSKKAFRVTNIQNIQSSPGKSTESSLNSKHSKDIEILPIEKNEEEMKSEFLNSFALTPIKALGTHGKAKNSEQCDNTKRAENFGKSDVNALCVDSLPPVPPNTLTKLSVAAAKRKKKENAKHCLKRFKEEVPEIIASSEELKRKTPTKSMQDEPQTISFKLAPFPIGGGQTSSIDLTKDVDEKLMPAPPPLKILRAFKTNDSNSQKNNKSVKSLITMKAKMETTNNVSFYKPIFTVGGNKPAPPGSRTPTTRRYPYILPRPNPFANIQAESKTTQSNDAEMKILSNSYSCDIKKCASSMNQENSSVLSKSSVPNSGQNQQSLAVSHHKIKPAAQTNYLNLALLNATKGKVDVPLGSRTPLYTSNSPIYSPNSPQYMPNYNIPTQPTYKYTKSQSNVSKYLSSVLGQNQQLSGLFPAPPMKKNSDITQSNITNANVDSFTVKKIESPIKGAPEDTSDNGGNDEILLTCPSKAIGNSTFSPPGALIKPITKGADTTVLNSTKTNEGKIKQGYEENKSPQTYTFANSLNTMKSDGPVDAPEKQAKVKSLLNSCKITIPSSLSITITTEENDSHSKSSSNAKLKSPVNNYIEILKLPENPSAKLTSLINSDVQVSQRLFDQQMKHIPQSVESNLSHSPNEGHVSNDMKPSSPKQFKAATGTAHNKQSLKELIPHIKPEKATAEKNLEGLSVNASKSPKSPSFSFSETEIEKLCMQANLSPPTSMHVTPKNNKSSKEQEISPSKKFRPILPRVELSSKDTPKPFFASSPPTLLNNSISMYNKSGKKSPSKTGKASSKSQKTTKKDSVGHVKNSKSAATVESCMKRDDEIVDLTSTPSLNAAPNLLSNQSHFNKDTDCQLDSSAQTEKNVDQSVDMSNFIEKSMRQLSSSNDIYMSNLAAAASFNPHFASVNLGYNLHQAMLLEQFSRIQKAGRDAFERFIENSKTKSDGNTTPTIKDEPESLQPKISPTPVSSEISKH